MGDMVQFLYKNIFSYQHRKERPLWQNELDHCIQIWPLVSTHAWFDSDLYTVRDNVQSLGLIVQFVYWSEDGMQLCNWLQCQKVVKVLS